MNGMLPLPADIRLLQWTKGARGAQLGVHLSEGEALSFVGFRDADFASLSSFCKATYGQELKERQMSTTGER